MRNEPLLLELQQVRKQYGTTQALNGVSVKISSGVIVGFLGQNGCGKTTLFDVIAGISRPTSGEVRIQGRKPSHRTKAMIAYMADRDFLYGWMTVGQIVDFYASFCSDWDEDRADAFMHSLALDPSDHISSLSKGFRARIKMLLALSRKAPLVLLDEPFTGVDPISKDLIVSSMMHTFQFGEQTILLSTHGTAGIDLLMDEIVLMKKGAIALHDTTERLRTELGGAISNIWREAAL